jgi:hypothetical protein
VKDGSCVLVQAVVPVWAEFPQGVVRESVVFNLEAARLIGWLDAFSEQLGDERRAQATPTIGRLATSPTPTEVDAPDA